MDVERVYISVVMVGVPMAVVMGILVLIHMFNRKNPGKGLNLPLTFLVSLVAGFASWWAWLSWPEYYLNDLGQAQGPYKPWHVIVCGLTVVVAVIAIGWWSRWRGTGPFMAAYGAITGFSFAWCYEASQDETGLFAFGFLLLLIGTLVGLSIVASIVAALKSATHTRKA